MNKEFKILNLHCADCARVLGEAITKISGVKLANIVFVLQKLTITFEEDADVEQVMQKIKKTIKDFSPNIVIEEVLANNYQFITERKWKVKGLDCAMCAQSVEDALTKLNGIQSCTVNYKLGTICVVFDENVLTDVDIINFCKKQEPTLEFLGKDSATKGKIRPGNILIGAGLVLGVASLFVQNISWLYWTMLILAVVLIGHQTYITAIKLLTHGVVNENLLVTISVVGAIIVGEATEGLMVVALYTIGKALEAMAVNRARRDIQNLIEIQPEYANIIDDTGYERKVNPEIVKIGQSIIVKPGEKVPIDGEIVSGTTSVNVSHLTGESVPILKTVGQTILSGSVVLDGVITVKTTTEFKDSAVSRILTMIEDASEKKSRTETIISKFSKYYTFIVMGLAVLTGVIVGLVTKNIDVAVYRGLIFLVCSCPCAFAISVPLSYFSGIGNASKHGILIKGSSSLDASAKLKAVAFDKTGTLTNGEFEVEEIESLSENYSMQDVLKFACWGEQYSLHPIARAIIKYGEDIKLREVENYQEIAGLGVCYTLGGIKIFVGSDKTEQHNNKTTVYVKADDDIIGKLVLSDSIKNGSSETIMALKQKSIKTIMLSGDNNVVAHAIGAELGIDEVYGEMTPEDKYNWLINNKAKNYTTGYVGDGINDAPSLAVSDVGISMGISGAESSKEASDIVLVDDNPERVVELIEISRHAKKIVIENIAFALIVKILFLSLGAIGVTGMIFAVFADVGVTIIAVLNSLRALFYKTKRDKQKTNKK